MTLKLKQIAMVALISSFSLPAYSHTNEERALRTQDQSTDGCVQTSALRKKAKIDETREARDGSYWFSRGYALHQSGHYIEAIDAFSHSIGLEYRQATSIYNVACGFALLNDKDNALFWLDRALRAGFDRSDLLKSDSDLDSIRTDPRFAEIIQRVGSLRSESAAAKQKEFKHADNKTQEPVLAFERLNRESSQDGDEWYRVGSRLIRIGEYDRGSEALTHAVENLGHRGASAMYNLACAYALKGDRDLALDWLEKSVNAGFDDPDHMIEDEDLASIRSQPRFNRVHQLAADLSLSQFTKEIDGSQYSKSGWAPAVRHYESFLRRNPNNGRGWFDLGYSLHYSSEHSKAIEAFERAIQLGYRVPTSEYNVACGHAMMGDRDAAFEWLKRSVNDGFDVGSYIRSDHDLDSLRSDSRFERFLRMADDHYKKK